MNWTCQCGREVPDGRECPTCSFLGSGWYGVGLFLAMAGMVLVYRLLH